MVHFTCHLVFQGAVFVNATKADAAKAAKKLLTTMDFTELSALALDHNREVQVGRVISKRAVRNAVARMTGGKAATDATDGT